MLLSKVSSAQSEVTFYTNMGNFVAKMYDTLQPITTGNFIDLVNAKYYDGVIFHRVINGFMIQGGDPTGTGSGGPGYTIPDEFDPLATNVQKAIAMANSGPNTGGSQFFINLVTNNYLNSGYPVFGIVITNFSVVQAIGAVATNSSDRPLTDVVMDSLRVTNPYFSQINDFSISTFNIDIFPNPVTEESVIILNSNTEKSVNVSIYNQLGKEIYSNFITLSNGKNYISLSEFYNTNLYSGLYHLVVTDGKSVTQKKFVVLR